MNTRLRPLCAVVPAQNDADSLTNVLRQLHRAGVMYCVVVVNGSTDITCTAEVSATRLFAQGYVMNVIEALGPDVPRAVGTYFALRRIPQAEQFVYVDGDWKGSFGPMLEEFLESGAGVDVELPAALPGGDGKTSYSRRPTRLDEELWQTVLAENYPYLQQAGPSLGPILVKRSVFAQVSPYWLHQPGRFFALCLLAKYPGLHIDVFRNWDTRILGNPARDREHSRKMSETLIGDALEGCRLLLRKRPSRVWKGRLYDGYHSTRRLDLLTEWQSETSPL